MNALVPGPDDQKVQRNPRPEYRPGKSKTSVRAKVFDTTLRDGEQSPGATLTSTEKSSNCDEFGKTRRGYHRGWVSDCISGRFRSGEKHREDLAGNKVYEIGTFRDLRGLSRANEKDIACAWEGVRHAVRPRITRLSRRRRFTWSIS